MFIFDRFILTIPDLGGVASTDNLKSGPDNYQDRWSVPHIIFKGVKSMFRGIKQGYHLKISSLFRKVSNNLRNLTFVQY